MEQHEQIILSWLKQNPLIFQYRLDNSIFTLKDLTSHKKLQFATKDISQHRLTKHPEGLPDYLNIVFQDNKQIVLCHAGIAFSPSFVSTGPLPDAPQVACMQDYFKLFEQLKAISQDSTRQQEALLLFQVLISILDGARNIGLDIGQEEENLDKLLQEFEKGKTLSS